MDKTDFRMERIKQMLSLLERVRFADRRSLPDWYFCECGYKKDNRIPDVNGKKFRLFKETERWGGKWDSHAWFIREVQIPDDWKGKDVRLFVSAGKDGQWGVNNSQFIAYVDGELRQGMDTNHTQVYLPTQNKDKMQVALYAYAGTAVGQDLRFSVPSWNP